MLPNAHTKLNMLSSNKLELFTWEAFLKLKVFQTYFLIRIGTYKKDKINKYKETTN